MSQVLIRHKVTNYEHFKVMFDGDAGRRRLGGSKGGHLFCQVEDPNTLIAVFEWDDEVRARQFTSSYELREASEWSTSAAGQWEAIVLREIEEVEA